MPDCQTPIASNSKAAQVYDMLVAIDDVKDEPGGQQL